MARELTAYGFTCGHYYVAPGASNALLVIPAPGEISSTVSYFSGGSLELIGCQGPNGQTGGVVAGSGYLFGSIPLNVDGAPFYYLCATGSTAVAYYAKGLSQGY